MYNDEGGLIEKVERVQIEAQELTELEKFKDKAVPKAILLNSDDWGYGYFMLDDASLKIFEKKLSKMSNKIDRAVVIGQINSMVKQIEYPAIRLGTVRE